MVRKVSVEGSPIKASVVASVALDTVAQELWNNTDEQQPKYTADSLRPRLAAVMTPWVNEGFFADVAVLVEGEGDRAAILAVADYLGYDLEATGFSVIPCMGKPNLDRPLVIFRALGVPTYVLWDSDQEGEDPKPDQNRSLLRLLGRTEEDWPGFVGSDAACFRTDLERTLEAELGKEAWNKHLDDARSAVGLTKKQAKKNPVVIRTVVQTAKLAGQTSPTLEQIVNSLWELRSSTTNKDEAEATPATVQSATTARVDKPAVPVLDTPCA
jgi:predicted ATP-dependent endonuclease of OLD family